MTKQTGADGAGIRQARHENPKMRERDLAALLGVTEADYVAAHVGHGARRIAADVDRLLAGVEALGEVMALTRNESAVHEKIGVYDKPVPGRHAAMVLGSEIDLRIFPGRWAHGFAVEKRDGDELRRSLQFFDAHGDAVHKIHLRPSSDLAAYEALVGDMLLDDQSDVLPELEVSQAGAEDHGAPVQLDELRDRWSRMTDTHQFVGLLRDLRLTRRQAVSMVGPDYAEPLASDSMTTMMSAAVESGLPIMCFVGNRGCIQIHSGPIHTVKPMGPWLNVMDPTFHLHLRTDHIVDVWAVRKPTKDGHVTSVEAYDAGGEMIIQFFGSRKEGMEERPEWRAVVDRLSRVQRVDAA